MQQIPEPQHAPAPIPANPGRGEFQSSSQGKPLTALPGSSQAGNIPNHLGLCPEKPLGKRGVQMCGLRVFLLFQAPIHLSAPSPCAHPGAALGCGWARGDPFCVCPGPGAEMEIISINKRKDLSKHGLRTLLQAPFKSSWKYSSIGSPLSSAPHPKSQPFGAPGHQTILENPYSRQTHSNELSCAKGGCKTDGNPKKLINF